MNLIHPTAIINKNIRLGKNVKIGAYCVLESDDLEISDNTELKAHIYISCPTKIGKNNTIYPFTSISEPQDKKYAGEKTYVVIGDNNIIRENVTINNGTNYKDMTTKIGNNNLIMSMSHIAHDCKIGNDIVISNGSQLAGHVEIHDNVIIGGMSGILQFSIIGGHSMIGGMSSVRGHIPPFSVFKGDKIAGVNIIGLRRKGFSNEEIFAIIEIFKNLADKESTLETKLKLIEKSNDKHISKIYRFLNELPANKNLKLADFW